VMVQKKEQVLGFSHLKTIQQPRCLVAMASDAVRESFQKKKKNRWMRWV